MLLPKDGNAELTQSKTQGGDKEASQGQIKEADAGQKEKAGVCAS